MSSLTFIALWGAALGAGDSDSYAEAHRQAEQKGQPIVVMVSTEWCVPCQMMKRNVIPQIRQRGLLKRVGFAIVNPDQDRDLAMQLTGGGPVPQLVMFRKTPDGWLRRKLIGGQSVEAVEEFINEGVAMDQVEAKAAPQKQPQETAKTAPAKEASSQATPIMPVSHPSGAK